MYIFLLFVLLIVFTVFVFLLYKKDILEPSFIFSLSFSMLLFMACINAKKWQLGLHFNTFLVILLGVIEFFCVGYLIKKVLKNKKTISKKKINVIELNDILEYIYLVFIIVFNLVFLYCVVNKVGNSFNSISSVMESINKYNNLNKFSNEFDSIRLPFLVSNMRIFIIASGYWFIYIIVNNFVLTKRVKFQEILIAFFAIIASMLTGSRTESIFMILSGITFYLFILNKKNGYASSWEKKTIKNICIVLIIIVALFVPMASLLGRKTDKSPFEYISIYCGAQVKNLDIFLQNQDSISKNEIWGSQTFNYIINTYGRKIGFKGYKPYKLDLPFQQIDGHSLGNVYTTFYPYIYDFGYFGEFIMVLIMSIISHYIYEKIKCVKLKHTVSLFVLTYGIIASALALSFFSNKFYEHLFSTSFLKYLFTWAILNYIFCNFKFKKAGLK